MFLSSSNTVPSDSDWHGSAWFGGDVTESRSDLARSDDVRQDLCRIQRLPHQPLALSTESPSFTTSNGSHEMKFVVRDDIAQSMVAWARQHLAADPHAGECADEYHVNSLYLDSPGFETYRRQPGFRRRKFRLRRYGQESTIWLEVKRKRNGHVRKRRVSVAEANLIQHLLEADNPEWEGTWFRRRLERRQLRPVCQVTYRRFARIGMSVTGPIRLTIDSDLFAADASDWHVPAAPLSGEPLLKSRRIVEFKFREVLPISFRGLIQDLRLEPAAFSKYRECVEACVPLNRLTVDAN